MSWDVVSRTRKWCLWATPQSQHCHFSWLSSPREELGPLQTSCSLRRGCTVSRLETVKELKRPSEEEKGENAGLATQGGASNVNLTQTVLERQDRSSAVSGKAGDGLLSINSSYPL